MIAAAKYMLIITATWFPTEQACEDQKSLAIGGDHVVYECRAFDGAAPKEAPLPAPKPPTER